MSSSRLGALAGAVCLAVTVTIPQATALGTGGGTARTATVGVVTTREFRAAVVATRLSGGSTPTAEVRVGLARRVAGSWRELGERRLGETYFWNTVSGPRAVCRLEIATAGTRPSFEPHVTVALLLTPSLGCGRTFRIPFARTG